MSFNRLNYDTGTYRRNLDQSVAPGIYHLNQPPINCRPCYPYSPSTILQRSGASVNKNMFMIDLDSELMGLYQKNTNNPEKKFKPKNNRQESGEPLGPGVTSCCSHNVKINKNDRTDKNLLHWRDCFNPPEDTRISNPNSNLREIGFNRFDWLCSNPQDKAELPFAHNIQNRILVKDNHRPIIPNPINIDHCLPRQKQLIRGKIKSVTSNNISPSSINWRRCEGIKKY